MTCADTSEFSLDRNVRDSLGIAERGCFVEWAYKFDVKRRFLAVFKKRSAYQIF